MAKISILLVRFIQFGVMLFYLYASLVYVGIWLVLPLGIFYHTFNLCNHLIGLNGVLASLFSISVVVGIGYLGYKIPNFYLTIWDSGHKLITLGINQVQEFGKIIQSIDKNGSRVVKNRSLAEPSN